MPKNKNIFSSRGFGERLRYLREKADFNQVSLAKKLGYSRSSSISNLENDQSPPDINILLKILDLFNCNLHWLITGELSPDGKAWQHNYMELFRAYNSLAAWALDRLECQLADSKKERTELLEKESRGEPINIGKLDFLERDIIPPLEAKIEQIKNEQKKAMERYSDKT